MPDQFKSEAPAGMAGGALARTRNLAHEAADLFRQFTESFRVRGQIRVLLIAGAGIVMLSAILLGEMCVKLLTSVMPDQPEWTAYGALGVPILGVGVALLTVAHSRMKSLDPLREQSAKVLSDATDTIEHVGQAVDAARQSFHDSAASVRDALNLHEQFNKRPWALMGAAVSLGYVGGSLLHSPGSTQSVPYSEESRNARPRGGAFSSLARQFAPEIVQLRGLALGALFGIVRDLAAKSAPRRMEGELEEVMNGITVKLGGKPVQGSTLHPSASSNGTSAETQ